MPGKILHVINEIRRITQRSNFIKKKKRVSKNKNIEKSNTASKCLARNKIVKNDESVDR